MSYVKVRNTLSASADRIIDWHWKTGLWAHYFPVYDPVAEDWTWPDKPKKISVSDMNAEERDVAFKILSKALRARVLGYQGEDERRAAWALLEDLRAL